MPEPTDAELCALWERITGKPATSTGWTPREEILAFAREVARREREECAAMLEAEAAKEQEWSETCWEMEEREKAQVRRRVLLELAGKVRGRGE